MKKFKTAFYGIYILYFLFAAFIAVYYNDIVLRWSWDPIDTWVGLIRFVLKMGGIGIVLFFTLIIIENIELFTMRKAIKDKDKEILELKSKLYDQTVTEEVIVEPALQIEEKEEDSVSAAESEES